MIRIGGPASNDDGMSRSVLDGGIEVLSERIPGVRSAAVGVWIRQGSVHESAQDAGMSHMLEHMVFKGTERRSAVEIAVALEGLGNPDLVGLEPPEADLAHRGSSGASGVMGSSVTGDPILTTPSRC